MKTYRVELSEPAEVELQNCYLSRSRIIAEDKALRWYQGLLDAIHSLNEWPRRFQMVELASSAGVEVRRMLYGKGPGAYHVIYRIIEPAEGDQGDEDGEPGIVRVQSIVSAVRRPPDQAAAEEEA